MKHTPGPWRVVAVSWMTGRGKSIQVPSVVMCGAGFDTRRIADCRDEEHGEPEVDEANARLICAAPEVLEALVDLVGIIDALGTQSGERMAKARAAIARARGEA